MGRGWRRKALLIALTGAMILPGCGGGDATTDDSAAAAKVRYHWVKGAAREFLVPGADNVTQAYGREASVGEREQASKLIHAWMSARAVTDWKRDCEYFSHSYARRLTADAHSVTGGRVKTCAQALAHFGPIAAASGNCKNTLDGPIDSLRIESGLGFAQYHGSDHKDYVISMQKEDGKWAVSNARPFGRFE